MAFDRRRGARLLGEFWVWVLGLDEGPRLRRGNLSISGAYFETEGACGDAGTVCRLRLGRGRDDFDRGDSMELLARVVRDEITSMPLGPHPVSGVGFEYMIENSASRRRVEAFVRAAAQSQLKETNDLDVTCHLPGTLQGAEAPDQSVILKRLSTESILLLAETPFLEGRRLRVVTRAPCSLEEHSLSLVVSGCAARRGAEGEPLFEIVGRHVVGPITGGVSAEQEAGAAMSRALELISEALVPSESCEPLPLPQLSGVLDQINLYSVLGFIEMERRTGVLRVEDRGQNAFLFIRHGQLIDVEAAGAGDTPRARLATVLGWTSGRFELTFRDVDRDDLLGEPTMAVLMDLAREQDELDAGLEGEAADGESSDELIL